MNTVSASNRRVVVCNGEGAPTGTAGVLEVHQGAGILHKAFSVFVFRNTGTEILLQQRSRQKKLFALRWANTCCSHPSRADELVSERAERRLFEELGFSVPLREAGSFVYRATDPNADLSEYEHDTVLVGEAAADVSVKPDPAEIAAWRWMSVAGLQHDLHANGDRYAPWLPEALRIALGARAGSSAAGPADG
ncbi:MAG TPA: isopentenyl-diphosphate Delta-isomerase, partial [Candidatus Binatia bacterium]|nr:isopentenyl-diphosphate Delta-isomerase [Candidatus Binatia bacterium]